MSVSDQHPAGDAPRFLADVMLGSLAKWLRILGYDTVYDNRIDDDHLIDRCRGEQRTALTRDVKLAQRLKSDILFINSEDLSEQIEEVLSFLGEEIDPRRILSRCLECNAGLETLPRQIAQTRVPPYVFCNHERFKRCPVCDRTYWAGTHREKIGERLQALARKNQRRINPDYS
ncbi:MAG: Mut7-C RNAse domain-containing protein [Acidobacteriota bacterium]